MTLVPVIVTVIILALVIVDVTRPLFTMQDEATSVTTIDSNKRLLDEFNAVLDQIRELDFEFNLGKLTVEEHSALRAELLLLSASLRGQLHPEDTNPGTTAV